MRNVGAADRWVRFSGGALLLILGFQLHPAPWIFWLLMALGATELSTGVSGFCPVYRLLGWSTEERRLRSGWPGIGREIGREGGRR